MKKIIIQGLQIAVIKNNEEEYISLTDMASLRREKRRGL